MPSSMDFDAAPLVRPLVAAFGVVCAVTHSRAAACSKPRTAAKGETTGYARAFRRVFDSAATRSFVLSGSCPAIHRSLSCCEVLQLRIFFQFSRSICWGLVVGIDSTSEEDHQSQEHRSSDPACQECARKERTAQRLPRWEASFQTTKPSQPVPVAHTMASHELPRTGSPYLTFKGSFGLKLLERVCRESLAQTRRSATDCGDSCCRRLA